MRWFRLLVCFALTPTAVVAQDAPLPAADGERPGVDTDDTDSRATAWFGPFDLSP